MAWLDDEGRMALDERVGVGLLVAARERVRAATPLEERAPPFPASPAQSPIRPGTRVTGVCPRPRVLEDVCDPPEARGAHGLAFLCIRAYIRLNFVSRARRE